MNIKINRPICFFDIEATGTNIVKDRIIEISFLKIYPNNNKEEKTWLLYPGISIPANVTAMHGISNDDVANKPTFKMIAGDIYKIIENSDLAGYNCNNFDIPLLAEELLRAGFNFNISKHNSIDVKVIFHKMEPRSLTAAYKYYCNKELIEAHRSKYDVLATYEVFKVQLNRYKNIKKDVKNISEFSSYEKKADLAGFIKIDESGNEIFNFGKYKGEKIFEVFEKNPGYYGWIQNTNLPIYTKKIFSKIRLKKKLY